MIIDFRVRPPFGGFKNSELFCDMDFHIPFSHRFGFELPESVKTEVHRFDVKGNGRC